MCFLHFFNKQFKLQIYLLVNLQKMFFDVDIVQKVFYNIMF